MRFYKAKKINDVIVYIGILIFLLVVLVSLNHQKVYRYVYTMNLGGFYVEILNLKAETLNALNNIYLDELIIELKPVDYTKLQLERSEMAANYVLNGMQWFGENQKFKSKIRYNDQNLSGKVKLFGMNPDHYRDSNGHSLRVSYNGGKGLGKKRVNVINPRSRGYISDFAANYIYKQLYDGIQIGYNPVKMKVNKQNYGIFLEEDFFDKYLIEKNFNRESVIFEILRKDSIHFNYLGKDNSFKELSDSLSNKIKNHKANLLELIDSDKLIGLITLSILANDTHQLLPINLHWYYNPVSGLIEPTYREGYFYPLNSSSITKSLQRIKSINLILKEFIDNIPDIENLIAQQIIRIQNSYNILISNDEFKQYKFRMYGFESQVNKQLEIFESNLNSFDLAPNLELNTKSKNIYIIRDTVFTNNFKVYKNENLIIKKGVKIKLVNSFIEIYGGLKVLGEKNAQVQIEGQGSNATFFINSTENIKISHAKFIGFVSKDGFWSLPAGITFYKSNKVTINDSFFSNNLKGDDFVNFFKCKNVNLENLYFSNVLSDAIDSDFSEISIKNSTFIGIGNDAVDASGGKIFVENCTFKKVQDKAISAGEGSSINSENNRIYNSALGIVVKDGSDLISNRDSLMDNQLDLVMFVKKPYYGYPKFTIENSMIQKNLIEKGCELNNFNQHINYQKDIESLLYGAVYGKSSK